MKTAIASAMDTAENQPSSRVRRAAALRAAGGAPDGGPGRPAAWPAGRAMLAAGGTG
jgi:hypothetical protein